MSDTAVEQQPEHKEEIVVQNGDDAVKNSDESVTENGKVTEAETTEKSEEKVKSVPKRRTSFSMTLSCKTIKAKFSSVNQMSTQDLQKLLDDKTSNLVILDVRPEEEYNISHLEGSQRVDPGLSDMDKLLEIVDSLKLENSDTEVVFYCSVGYRSSQLASKLVTHLKKATDAASKKVADKSKAEEVKSEEAVEEKKEPEETTKKEETEDPKAEVPEATDEKPAESATAESNEAPEPTDKKPELRISNLEGSLFKWANEDRPMVNNENEAETKVHFFHKIWCKTLRKDLRWKPAKPVKEEKKEEPKQSEEKPIEKTEQESSEKAETPAESVEAVKTEEAPKTPDEHATQPTEVAAAA